ncbi:integrase [Cyanophage SS120-1]|uniref:Integrase n=1 Tax=Cyanophage SS120-1 TaxID=616674 RepID=M1T338_9CAUD|nr:integrase [Cyanophage SS120-1]AGG54505.1 integrase [Cyanophage SS120-1]
MTTATLKTWGQIKQYTWDHRWKKQKSAENDTKSRIARLTHYWGDSLPLRHLEKGHTFVTLQDDLISDYDISNARVNKIVSAATTALDYTCKLGLHSTRAPYFERLQEDESRQAWYTKDEVDKLAFIAVDLFDRQELADAILFSAYTGLRRGEFLRLRVQDVDLTTNVVWVGGRPETSTKTNSTRSVPINDKIKHLVLKRLELKKKGLLFGDEWLNKHQLYKQFMKVKKRAGFDEAYCWHSLRHSFCTWAGTVSHPRTIMAAAGHKSMDTTLKYCKAVDEEVHAMIAKL